VERVFFSHRHAPALLQCSLNLDSPGHTPENCYKPLCTALDRTSHYIRFRENFTSKAAVIGIFASVPSKE